MLILKLIDNSDYFISFQSLPFYKCTIINYYLVEGYNENYKFKANNLSMIHFFFFNHKNTTTYFKDNLFNIIHF